MANTPDTTTVAAARDGDPGAVDQLVRTSLPLVHSVVGRALDGHADVEDVVQETMLRVLRGLPELRDPDAYRSWLVAITVRQVRERHRSRRVLPDALVPEDTHDPGADFTDVTIARLELTGQRRETAEATRWLEKDDRELLSLWWLEASGHLTRDDLVEALGVTRQHAAVRVQRMKTQLDTARGVVRALAATPPCPDLADVTAAWDGRPSGLWRKRVARHARECPQCAAAWSGLVRADALLSGMALVPVPALLEAVAAAVSGGASAAGGAALGTTAGTTAAGSGTVGGTAAGGTAKVAALLGASVGRRVVTTVLVTGLVGGGGAAVALDRAGDAPAAGVQALPTATATPSLTPTRRPAPPRTPTPSATPTPTPEPTPEVPPVAAPAPTAEPAPPVAAPPPATVTSGKKGVATWQFDGVTGALGDVGASWYYNWSPTDDAMPAPGGVEFVPMIWGRDHVTDATLAQAAREGSVLLGFNEPDLGEQSAMSVEEALDLWPRLEATGMRLGSPAVAWGGDTPGGWLDRFMTGARERGLRVDFVTLHWYGSDFGPDAVDHFLGYVDAVHARYGLPVWVTEYGLMNFGGSPRYPTGAQAAAFIEGSSAGMQARPFVERYAWFGLPAVGDSVDFGLYRDATTPTQAGLAYRAAGG